MGYTHYWGGGSTAAPAVWEALQGDVRQIVDAAYEMGITIRGLAGLGGYELTESMIGLNGDSDADEDYESFMLTNPPQDSFCKTAEHPYDLVVCAVLIRAQHHLGIRVRSDGGWSEEGWSAAALLCEGLFGALPEMPQGMEP